MLITFRTKGFADITMFGDVAQTLLRLMGQSGDVPGALLAEDVAAALDRLKAGIDKVGAEPAGNPPRHADEDDDKAPPPVTLKQRAFPLMGLLEAARRNKHEVMWAEARNPLL